MAQSLSTNQNYLVSIRKGSGSVGMSDGTGSAATSGIRAAATGNIVTANAQAKLQIQINNQWVNILQAIGISGGGGGGLVQDAVNAVNAFQIFTGNNFLPQIATSHVWRGSNGLEINLVMRFDAVEDPVKDVLSPVKKLIGFWMPERGGLSGEDFITRGIGSALSTMGATDYVKNSFLHPPGPTPLEYARGEHAQKMMTVTLGKAMIITDLIPTTLAWEFEERFTKDGTPVAAQVTCGFISYVTPTKTQMLDYFTNKSA